MLFSFVIPRPVFLVLVARVTDTIIGRAVGVAPHLIVVKPTVVLSLHEMNPGGGAGSGRALAGLWPSVLAYNRNGLLLLRTEIARDYYTVMGRTKLCRHDKTDGQGIG